MCNGLTASALVTWPTTRSFPTPPPRPTPGFLASNFQGAELKDSSRRGLAGSSDASLECQQSLETRVLSEMLSSLRPLEQQLTMTHRNSLCPHRALSGPSGVPSDLHWVSDRPAGPEVGRTYRFPSLQAYGTRCVGRGPGEAL